MRRLDLCPVCGFGGDAFGQHTSTPVWSDWLSCDSGADHTPRPASPCLTGPSLDMANNQTALAATTVRGWVTISRQVIKHLERLKRTGHKEGASNRSTQLGGRCLLKKLPGWKESRISGNAYGQTPSQGSSACVLAAVLQCRSTARKTSRNSDTHIYHLCHLWMKLPKCTFSLHQIRF